MDPPTLAYAVIARAIATDRFHFPLISAMGPHPTYKGLA